MAKEQDLVVRRRGWVTADFFTHDYRISGQVDVRHRPLADQLNDRTTSYLDVEGVYISPIDRPGEITASYPISSLLKDNITMVVLARQEDGLSKKQTYGSYFGTYLREVFLTIPGFEVRGLLQMSGKLDLRAVLAIGTDRFIPILDGTIFATLNPKIQFTGGIILVNKDVIGAICIPEEG